MNVCLRALLADENGATLVEYTLVLTLIAIVAIVAIKSFGSNTSTVLNRAATSI